MTDTTWLEPDEGRPQRDRRRLRLAALAVIPWLIVAGLLVLPRTAAEPEPTEPTDGGPTDTATSPPETGRAPTPEDPHNRVEAADPPLDEDTAPSAPSLPEAVEIRGRWRLHAGVEEAASVGLVVARAALTGVAPVLEIDGVTADGPDRYAEHLVVEAVEQTGIDAMTVTVVAIVLTTGDELGAEVARLAVPITLDDDGAHPAGPPWQLPAPSLTPRPPQLDPVDDPQQHQWAAEALDAAGLTELELASLLAAEGGPAAAVTRSADGTQQTVWLRRHLDGFVVAGVPLARARTDAPPHEASTPAEGATP